ncbi:uncharacterized protein LOC135470036 [Liolophura sinensis]|uniref:uncharacterized protein LOC135470036 n=1 Tax=Liolophura sinensis TaxID=3198878 RepID=UPI003159055B
MLTKVLTGKLTFTSLKPLDLTNFTRQELRDYFNNSYDLNESLFTSLKDDSVMYQVPDRLRLPLIFYYAHTASVFVNKLILAGLLEERVNLEFETMFETGVDEMSWDDTENYRMGGSYKWPNLDEVVDYRRQVRNLILAIIDTIPLDLPVTMDTPMWALFMGMEHERIHVETSSVLIRQLPVTMVTRPDGWVYGPSKHGQGAGENKLVRVEKQDVTFGKPRDFPSYGWDNEYGEVSCSVPEFDASQYLITNREFLEFVKAGGYQDNQLWSEEGWAWRVYKDASHPIFWTCDKGCKSGCGGVLVKYSHCQAKTSTICPQTEVDNGHSSTTYRYRLMFDEIEMPLDWPVTVNYHEARAYCAWRGPGFRLPAEAEHQLMRGTQKLVIDGVSSDIIYSDKIEANINLQYGSSTPVNLYSPTSAGFYDVFGNVWEWTEDHFNGLPGYQSHWLYDDFSSPCFDGRHNMILGGSWISTGDEASRFARYSFRRHFFQHCGFRVVCSVSTDSQKPTLPVRLVSPTVFIPGLGVTENKTPLIKQVEVEFVKTTNSQFTFDEEPALWGITELEFGFRDDFASSVAEAAMFFVELFKAERSSALHLGSGLGKISFLLNQHFDKVLGVDFSGRFISSALTLQEHKQLTYHNTTDLEATITLPPQLKTNNVVFKQWTWVPNEVGQHDLVLLTFLDRTLHPKAWLVRLWEIVRKTGIVVIVSRDNWNRETLAAVFGNRLHYADSKSIEYELSSGRHQTLVTVWRRE